jgi:hypothetical protein
MVVQKRIRKNRKQSRIVSPTRNLWFLSDESLMNQSQATEKKSFRNDRESIFNDDYTRYGQGNTGLPKMEKECTFVVDWQMSDAF